MRKEITLMGEQVSIINDKSGKILFAEYTNSSDKNKKFYCGPVLINSMAEKQQHYINGFSLNPIASQLKNNCNIDLSTGNKFIISCEISYENENRSMSTIVFEDVTSLEKAITEMFQDNSLGGSSFFNPNSMRKNAYQALHPVSLIKHDSSKKRGIQEPPVPYEILSGDQVDWTTLEIDCKNFLLQIIGQNIAHIEFIQDAMEGKGAPSIMNIDDIITLYNQNIKPGALCKPETALAYNTLHSTMMQRTKEATQK